MKVDDVIKRVKSLNYYTVQVPWYGSIPLHGRIPFTLVVEKDSEIVTCKVLAASQHEANTKVQDFFGM